MTLTRPPTSTITTGMMGTEIGWRTCGLAAMGDMMSAPFQEKGARRRLDRTRAAFTFIRIHTAKATFGAAYRVHLFCLFEYEDRASLLSFRLH